VVPLSECQVSLHIVSLRKVPSHQQEWQNWEKCWCTPRSCSNWMLELWWCRVTYW